MKYDSINEFNYVKLVETYEIQTFYPYYDWYKNKQNKNPYIEKNFFWKKKSHDSLYIYI